MSSQGQDTAGRRVDPTSRAMRWTLGVGLAAIAAMGLVLLYLLTQATNNREMYESNYSNLFAINVVVAVLLLLVIGWIAARLVKRFVQGRFGSRLLVKLAAVFALAGFMPGVLIYVVSYQFVSRSIESWFDVKVEGALEAGLSLGRSALDNMAAELTSKTRVVAQQMQDTPDTSAAVVMEKYREQLNVRDAQLWSSSGLLIASVGDSKFLLNPERPTLQQYRTTRSQRAITWIEGLEEPSNEPVRRARIKALVLVPSVGLNVLEEPRYLQVTQELSDSLIANALAVTDAHREYQERALARDGLRRMYIGTLTLSLFLAVFGSVLLAVVLGNQITRPLLLLAEGVRQVAAGDLTPKAVLLGRDELGGLTRSFADMTQQLSDARRAVERSMQEVSTSRENLQTILDNLTAGVMVLNQQGEVQSANPGATRILRAPLAACEGQRLGDIVGLEEFADKVQQQFDSFQEARAEHGLDHWQQSIELGNSAAGVMNGQSDHGTITLVARGAELPGNTWLLVFDDISEIVSAQRSQAWGEVARRLAHEIKNPLTPIQLSAERLEKKLTGKVDATDQQVLSKSVKTIVDQVDAMKRLVNEFRDYARLPTADLKPIDLNQIAIEVFQLYGHEGTAVPVVLELDERCPQILGDKEQIRQVLHNLLQNAQDATDSAGLSGPDNPVILKTQWSETKKRVRLIITDRGTGFPETILKRAFEPYVTTKPKGTGLGLAVVKKIADEHGARIDISNRVVEDKVAGAQVSLSFAIDKVVSA